MSTNPNLQQINVFSKGMNTDTSDAYIPNDLYRYAENLRFVTDEGENSGELRLIEGYNRIDYGTGNHSPNQGTIIAVTTIRNFIITLENKQSIGYIVLYNTEKPVSEQRYEPIAIDEEWDASLCYSLVTRWEAENNIKLYVADGEHKLTSFLIDPNGDELQHIKSIEQAFSTGGGYIFGGFGNIERTTGLLKPAIVLYVYVLYSKYGGKSNLSPSTLPISLYYGNAVHKGQMKNPYTNVGLIVTIKERRDENRYDKILVYRITYSELGQHPNIDLIIDDDLKDSDYSFYDDGQYVIESNISFAEFVALDYMEVCPQYIESKNDYLFAGNFSYYTHDDTFDVYSEWDPKTEYIDDGITHKYVDWEFEHTSPTTLGNDHSNYRTLQRGETYRYGILLYDKYGTKWPIKHIADITVAEAANDNPIVVEDGVVKTISVGVKFKVNKLDEDLFPYYEIVRVPRGWNDRRTIAQGIIGRAAQNIATKKLDGETDRTVSNKYYPLGFLTMGNISVSGVYISGVSNLNISEVSPMDSDLLQFCSPEVSYGKYLEDVLGSIEDTDSLEVVVKYYIKTQTNTTNNQDYRIFSENGISFYKPNLQNGLAYIYNKTFKSSHPDYRRHLSDPDYSIIDKSSAVNNIYPALNIILTDTSSAQSVLYPINNYFRFDVDKFKYAESVEYNGFSKQDDLTFENDTLYIGNKVFINWSAGMLEPFLEDSSKAEQVRKSFKEDNFDKVGPDYTWYEGTIRYTQYPIGGGGTCLLLNVVNRENNTIQQVITDPDVVTIANIKNKNIVPYGGSTTIPYSTYSSFGNYFSNNQEYHSVFDGDCYILLFYYNALHTWYSDIYWGAPRMSTVYIVPIETTIDMNSDHGDSYKRVSRNPNINELTIRYILDKAVTGLFDYSQEYDACMYNTAYSSEPSIKISTSVDYDDLKNNKFDYRVAYSMLKSNNERYDSWLQFKSGDYIDVDTRYGEITNLRLFKDQLVFWLKNATGLLSVNERTMLQDVNDTNIILGNGDVLQRYDYLTTEYGMKEHLMCDAQSDTTLYWWDSFKKDIISYPGGRQVLPLKRQKQVSKYLTNGTEVEHPCLAHDIKYNEIIASVVDDPIVYSELIQQFTSIYKTPFDNKANILDGLILFNQGSAYNWDEKGVELLPMLKYIVNDNHTMVKVYDNTLIGMGEEFYYDNFYDAKHYKRIGEETLDDQQKNGGGIIEYWADQYGSTTLVDEIPTQPLKFEFDTTKQHSEIQKDVTNREYDLRFAVPRQCTKNEQTGKWEESAYCDRMRGRTMECTLTSSSSSTKFSIQYIITKYRISWS